MNDTIRSSKTVGLFVLSAIFLAGPGPAAAMLGENLQSIQADQIRMKATPRGSAGVAGGYTVHEMQTPAGTIVKEYAGSDGRIFAVSWKGPVMPDLRQLLGRHFDTYANGRQAVRRGHAHATFAQSGIVVHSRGHMRAFSGVAYIPELLPAGVSVEEIG